MRRWLLTPLVVSLFALSFIESWAALMHAADKAEIPWHEPWPWMVDGFIVVMALMVVEARRTGHNAGVWWPRVGLVGATALSTAIQVMFAPAQAQYAGWLAAWSPLAVLFSFECLVWLVFARAPEPAAQPLPVPATQYGPPAGSSGHDQMIPTDAQIISVSAQTRPKVPARASGLTDQQRARVVAWRAENPPRSARWIAGQLGLSNHARSKHLAPLIEQLQVARVGGPADNGNGPA